MKKLGGLFLLFCSVISVNGKTAWELKKDKEGIKVYTSNVPNSNIKAVKVECTVNASLTQLTALLLDSKAHEQWVYSTKSSHLVKKISDNQLIYYSEMSMPWPITNRDVVVDLKLVQDPSTKVLTVTANTIKGYTEPNNGIVRVPLSKVTWLVTPVAKDQLLIEYVAQLDPGGSVPAWAVNMFSTKGPFETFKKLRQVVIQPAYQQANFDFVKE